MRRLFGKVSLLVVLSASATTPLVAQTEVGPNSYAVTLSNLDLSPATASAARRTLSRIDEAALAICGAPRGSLREVRRATRKSACWKESVDRAVAQIDNPLLTRVYRRGA